MNTKKATRKAPSAYTKELLSIIDEFAEETDNADIDMVACAAWAIRTGRMEPQKADIIRQTARLLTQASRQDFIANDKGEPVRRRHPYMVRSAERQGFFWFAMDNTTPEKMRISYQQRRKRLAGEIGQRDRDIKHYNEHYNPGDPIEADWDFNADIAEKEHSGVYDDTPPPDAA